MPDPYNLNNSPIRVAHAELERYGEDSAYKSKCPVCEGGILLVTRLQSDGLKLSRYDSCVSCGQTFFYTDDTINGEEFSKRCPFPMFELVGPPCELPGCNGVLVNTIALKTQIFSKKCSVCHAEFNKMPVKDAMAWAVHTIERVFKGEGTN
jgi:hypothetical protein